MLLNQRLKVLKKFFYLKHPWGFILTENLVEAKLFSSYETARKTMDYAKNKQDLFIDEIVEVKVDNFGNVVEIEGGKEMQKLYVVTAINQGKGSKGVFYLSDKEGLVLTENVENAYFFKNRTLAKEYVNEVEGNYPECDLVVFVQEVRLSAEGIKFNDVDEIEGGKCMQYRKKPVVIEAFQYDGDFINQNGEYYIPQWAVEAYENGTLFFDGATLKVKTLEGDVTVDVNDYIIKGKNGEMIPCQSYLKKMENPYTNAKENEVTPQREFSVINIEDGIEVTKVSSHQTLSTLEKTANGIKISFEPKKDENVSLYIGETEVAKVKKGMNR